MERLQNFYICEIWINQEVNGGNSGKYGGGVYVFLWINFGYVKVVQDREGI